MLICQASDRSVSSFHRKQGDWLGTRPLSLWTQVSFQGCNMYWGFSWSHKCRLQGCMTQRWFCGAGIGACSSSTEESDSTIFLCSKDVHGKQGVCPGMRPITLDPAQVTLRTRVGKGIGAHMVTFSPGPAQARCEPCSVWDHKSGFRVLDVESPHLADVCS